MGDHPARGVDVPPDQWPTGRLLSTAARRVERAWDTYLERWSLSHASLPALAVLAGGARSQRELADHLHVTEQTVSRMLLRLERAGYVRREAHATDRRRRQVAVTQDGMRALGALDDPGTVEALVAHDLTGDELDQLRALLVRLVSHDGEQAPPTTNPRRPR